MSHVNNFFTVSDFATILNDFGRELIHVPFTKQISNYSGKETLVAGTPVVIEAYFMRSSQGWDYEKAGFLEKGDCILLSKYTDAVEKEDLVYADGINIEMSSIDGDATTISITTSSAHGLSVGDEIVIVGTTNYDGVYDVDTALTSVTLTIADTSHDKDEELIGQINKDYNKFRIKEFFNVASVFDNAGGATTFTYTACNCFIYDES